ncbi:MAG: L-seryl-tRNA(Sec) selenium transferase [Syntrophobacteraceae bacterium]|nr:L-seryl-tRNA(Sec) selenium transferase [Syntrophobacteraceae bacterium]
MTESAIQELLRKLPSVDALLHLDPVRTALSFQPRKMVLESLRHAIETQRRRILDNPGTAAEVDTNPLNLARMALDHLQSSSGHTLRKVVNATGIIIHTNLGRSLLPEEAVERLVVLCRAYNNLEYDLDRGRRGSRYVHAEAVLCELTGAEAALAVNNNAGAVLLVLNTLARNREVIVSRGQLVEIGGSFRIPDVMRAGGATLRDVGCTNRTHLRDYEAAINDQTAAIMKVHASNYRIIGFTAEVPLEDLVILGRRYGLPVIEDLGSGCLIDLSQFGLHGEPTVRHSVHAGADVVTFSGDKLLGGPQAGIIVGRKKILDECKKNPLTRALRVDKMTLAALEATLRLYRDERHAVESIPTLGMIALPLPLLEERAHALVTLLREIDLKGKFEVSVRPCFSQVGGGSLPGQDLPSRAVAVSSPEMSANRMETLLRANKPPIIGRIESDQYLMDVRTIQPGELVIIRDAFSRIVEGGDQGNP